jgi:hypothetical protein
MSDILEDTLIVIPSRRPPPISTLAAYPTERTVVVLADPYVYQEHRFFYARKNVKVIEGERGLVPQILRMYRIVAEMGFAYFFRLDDDLQPGFFIDIDRNLPDLEFVMKTARECIAVTETSLAGFSNTSRIDWLDYGFKRSIGLIHGGAQICESSATPKRFLDPSLRRHEDVYRTLAHREKDGAVGKVSWIGLDKSVSTQHSVAERTDEIGEEAKQIILTRFPTMVKSEAYETHNGVRMPKFRMLGRATYP